MKDKKPGCCCATILLIAIFVIYFALNLLNLGMTQAFGG